MKKLTSIITVLILLIFLSSCAQSLDMSKEDALEAIQSYKNTLYHLGASNNTHVSRNKALSLGIKIDKNYVAPTGNSSGIDSEWLDMSIIVLNFSEVIINSEYTLGDEVVLFDILEDSSMWGWETTTYTNVQLTYIDEVLYLRVTNPNILFSL